MLTLGLLSTLPDPSRVRRVEDLQLSPRCTEDHSCWTAGASHRGLSSRKTWGPSSDRGQKQ